MMAATAKSSTSRFFVMWGAYALGGATPPGTLHVMDDHEFRPRNDLPTWMRLAVVGFLAVLVGAVILGMAVY